MIAAKLQDFEGRLYVVWDNVSELHPVITRMWWPVEQSAGCAYNANRPSSGDIAVNQHDGRWVTHRESPTISRTGSVYVDGKKQAERVETINVPCPKVRAGVETRWYQGEWQKLLKKGWVPA
jgi:hypothetical protein